VAVRNHRLAELAVFLALTLLHTWPLATDPAHLSRLDNDDTAFNTWVVAWVEHQLPRDPLHLFEAPAFYPEHDTLAYSEHLVMPSILGLPFHWAGFSPVTVYNLLVMLGHLLSALAMSWLVSRWTGSFTAGLVAGMLFAFNAHVLTRFAHLQALHVEFIPLVLYALDRLLDEARLRHCALLTVAFVLQSLCSNITMVMLTAGLGAAVAVRPEFWTRKRRIWPLLAVAGAASVVLLLPFLLPYYRLHRTQGLTYTIEHVRLYSAGWADYLSTAGRLHLRLWSQRFIEGHTALFPGITAIALVAVTLWTSTMWRDHRARLALAIGLIGLALSFGANLPGYGWLHDRIMILQGMRAAARWGYLSLVAVAILAGFGMANLEQRYQRRPWWPAVAIGIMGLVTIEALRAPLALTRFEGIPAVHKRLRDPSIRAIVVFPLYAGESFNRNAPYLLAETRHWRPMVNGYSSFAPDSFFQRARRLQRFPAPESLAELRAIGVSHVLVDRARLERDAGRETVAALRSHAGLELNWEDDGWMLYRLRGSDAAAPRSP
jgi:hypothetical protein